MKFHEKTIATTLKWLDAEPSIGDHNSDKYEQWKDCAGKPLASTDVSNAIKYQAARITLLEDALRTAKGLANIIHTRLNDEVLSKNALEAQRMNNSAVRNYITDVLSNEGGK